MSESKHTPEPHPLAGMLTTAETLRIVLGLAKTEGTTTVLRLSPDEVHKLGTILIVVDALADAVKATLALEREAHTAWDASWAGMTLGNPPEPVREAYRQQTYRATRLHRKSQDGLRAALSKAEGRE